MQGRLLGKIYSRKGLYEKIYTNNYCAKASLDVSVAALMVLSPYLIFISPILWMYCVTLRLLVNHLTLTIVLNRLK